MPATRRTAMKKTYVILTVLLVASCATTQVPRMKVETQAPVGLLKAAMYGDEVRVQEILAGGADVNAKDVSKGNTALHAAAEHGHFNVSRLLVESGARVDMANEDGYTPLHKAAAMGDYDTSALLVEKGADVKARTSVGDTPLHFAAEMRNFEMAQMVKAMGVKSNYNWKTDNEKVAAFLIQRGAELDARDKFGRTPLQRTTPWNNYPVAKLLIDSGADASIKDNDGLTPYDHAKAKGAKDVAKLLNSLEKKK
jgi:ankyrin repeat protein